jgi:RsiW-degrading membrane proteinase PrsW (M82 family)
MEFQNIDLDIDLVSSGLAAIGSFILVDKLKLKDKATRVGVWLIFAGFVIQALWNSYNTLGLSTAIGVLVIVIVGLLWELWKPRRKKK